MSSFDKLLISSLSPILGSVLTVFIVDVKVIGRRYALLLSLGVVILCLFILGLSFSETKVTTEDPGNVIVLGLLEIHLVLHSLGLKSLPYILNVELQLFRFSELGAGIGAVVGWLIHLLVSTTNESLLKDLGWNGAFFLSAFVSTVMLIVLAFILPETQGLELEEVEKLFLF